MDQVQGAWPGGSSGIAPAITHPASESVLRRSFGAVGFMADTIRRRRSGRIALWSLVVALTAGGLWLLAYPVVTDIWANRLQDGLEQDFQALEGSGDPNATGYATKPSEGKALTRLRIPKLNVNIIVVEGVTGNALRAGAGHFPDTALPGSLVGNVAIAGHRTGYSEPFRHVDRLTKGDQIFLDTPFGTFLYRVMGPFDGHGNPWVTAPTNLSVKFPTGEPVLTLVTCDPPGTSKYRLIVRARLIRELPD